MSTSVPRVRVRGVVGESVERPDAVPKVKGEFEYASDLRRDGMLFGATLRSPHAHARIAGIETSAAKRMSGVRAVMSTSWVRGGQGSRPARRASMPTARETSPARGGTTARRPRHR